MIEAEANRLAMLNAATPRAGSSIGKHYASSSCLLAMKKRLSLGVPKGVFSFAKENTPFDSLPCAAQGNHLHFLQEENKRLPFLKNLCCNGVQREHNKKLNNGLPILHKVPPKRDYGRYFCIMAEKGGTSHGGLTEKLSLFFHAKKQEVNAYGR
jgi:hypothetical protein